MAKGVYVGVSGKARKTKNIYIGIGGKARRVLKGYIGIGGKAKLFFLASGQVVKSFDNFLDGVYSASTSNASYAIFAGGYHGWDEPGEHICKAVNKSLTVVSCSDISGGVWGLAATSIGNYALFAGGQSYSGGSDGDYYMTGTGIAYDTSLTLIDTDGVGYHSLAATSNSSYAFFAGGTSKSGTYRYTFKYNSSLTRSQATNLTNTKNNLGSTTVNNYCLFAGGYDGTYSNPNRYSVDAYNSSGTKSTPSDLSVGRYDLAGGTINNNALFIGGSKGQYGTDFYTQTVDAYNSSLTKSTLTDFPIGCNKCVTANTNDKLLIGGGEWNLSEGTSKKSASSRIYAYNNSLTCSLHSVSLLNTRWGMTATTFGSYALFGSGKIPSINTWGGGENLNSLVVFN